MRTAVLFLAAVVLLTSCTRETSRGPLDETELDRIRTDLAASACVARMDSLCFEIDGLLYEASLENGDAALIDLLPDTLPVCPLSDLPYLIQETPAVITVTCPSGHGSQTLTK